MTNAEIKTALETVDSNVYYGAGRVGNRSDWDCIVFGRRTTEQPNSTTWTHRWFVAVVREEEIPDGLVNSVIQAMDNIKMKISGDISYDYTQKANECAVEVAVIEFVKSEKRDL